MSNKDDTLILGFHLDKNLEALKQRYEDSYKFKDLITNFIKNPELDKVKFEVNKQKRQIEAWYDNTLIFHSKKFSPNRIKEIVLKYGFKSEFQCNDENSCIIGFYYDTKT